MLPIVIIFQRGFNDDIECLYIKETTAFIFWLVQTRFINHFILYRTVIILSYRRQHV